MKNTEFGFTADTAQKGFKRVSKFVILRDLLNSNLSVKEYGNIINEIVFVYLAIDEKVSFPIDNFKKYRRKNKVLEIGLNLDYQKLLQSDKSETMQMLSELYLRGIKEYMNVKDFDNEKFYVDVKNLFEKNGLLKTQDRAEKELA